MLARVSGTEFALVEQVLSVQQVALFNRMHRIDQRHCLDVFHTLYRAGYRDAELLRAALLHDVGKTAGRMTIFHRVAVVLMGKAAPDLLARLAHSGRKWTRGFAVHALHPQVGAQLVGGTDTPQVALLVKGHHDPDPQRDTQMAALHWADGQN
jgi:hypothetical protein